MEKKLRFLQFVSFSEAHKRETNEVNETNLVLGSSFMQEDEEMTMEGVITIYLSK